MANGYQLNTPHQFLALGFGSGLSPKAPGTMGTLAAIPLILLLNLVGPGAILMFVLLGFAIGVYVCDKTAKELGEHDHPAIVWDEIIGFAITMLFVEIHFATLIAGFLLFRVFDIWKPFPINIIDRRVKGGLGIMLDDVLAGLIAGGWLLLLINVFHVPYLTDWLIGL